MLTAYEMQARVVAERRRDLEPTDADRLFCHMVVGVGEEAGEISGLLKRKFKGMEIPKVRWMEELGDVLWYLLNVADLLEISLEELYQYNQLKLEGRYKDDK